MPQPSKRSSHYHSDQQLLTIWAYPADLHRTIHQGYVAVTQVYEVPLNISRQLVHAALARRGWRHDSHREIVRAWKALRGRKAEHLA